MTKPSRRPADFDLLTDLQEARAAQLRKVNEAVMFRTTCPAQLAALAQATHDIMARAQNIDEEIARAKEHLERIVKKIEEATAKPAKAPKPTKPAKAPTRLDQLLAKLAAGDTSVIPELQALAKKGSM